MSWSGGLVDWTARKLKDLARWANRWIWRTVKFADYGNQTIKQGAMDE